MEFWVVPNSQGLPTVDAAAIVAAGGVVATQAGKGCGLFAPSGSMVNLTDNTGTPLDWRGNLAGVDPNVIYDDLGFYSNSQSTRFTIPDVDPPIERVQVWCGGGFGQGTAGERQLTARKNLSFNHEGAMAVSSEVQPVGFLNFALVSGVFAVVAGDFFDFNLGVTNAGDNNSDFVVPRGGLLVVK